MPGKTPGGDEYGVASKGEAGRPRVPRQPARAARAIRLRFVALIEIAAISRSARALTSTKAIDPPLRAMRSISPPDTANRRSEKSYSP